MSYGIPDSTLADALSSVPITSDLLGSASSSGVGVESHAASRAGADDGSHVGVGVGVGVGALDPDLHAQYTYHDADAQSEFYHHQVQPNLGLGPQSGGSLGAQGENQWHEGYHPASTDTAGAPSLSSATPQHTGNVGAGAEAGAGAGAGSASKKARGEKRKRTYALDRPVNSLADLVDHTPAQILSGPPGGDITQGPIYIRPLGGASQACVRCHRIKRKCDFVFNEEGEPPSSVNGQTTTAAPSGGATGPGEQKKRCSGCARSGVPCVFEVTAATVRYIEELTAERDELARRVKMLEQNKDEEDFKQSGVGVAVGVYDEYSGKGLQDLEQDQEEEEQEELLEGEAGEQAGSSSGVF